MNILLKAEAYADVILNNGWEGNGHKSIVTRVGGVAFLNVLVRNGITINGTTICTIPLGFRPYMTLIAFAISPATQSVVVVNPNGEIKPVDNTIPTNSNVQIIASWLIGS